MQNSYGDDRNFGGAIHQPVFTRIRDEFGRDFKGLCIIFVANIFYEWLALNFMFITLELDINSIRTWTDVAIFHYQV